MRYWEQRRLLEALSTPDSAFEVFVHPSLGEAAAARYVETQLSDDEVKQWVGRIRRLPVWREPLLLSAGRSERLLNLILTSLLDHDDPADPASTEAVTGAAILADEPSCDPTLRELVILQLRARLSSAIPLIAYEALKALLPIARQHPPLVAATLHGLSASSQPWTKISALGLAVACGDGNFDWHEVDVLIRSIVLPAKQTGLPSTIARWRISDGGHEARSALIVGYAELVASRRDPERLPLLEDMIASGRLSVDTGWKLRDVLVRHGLDELQARAAEAWKEKWGHLAGSTMLDDRDGERALLESIVRVTNARSLSNVSLTPSKLQQLPLLLAGMNWLSAPAFEIRLLESRRRLDETDAAVKGTIVALSLEEGEVGREARWAFDNLDAFFLPSEDRYGSGLFEGVPSIALEPDWSKAAAGQWKPDVLAAGLLHPSSVVARCCAELLAAGAGGEGARDCVLTCLHSTDADVLRLTAPVLFSRWGAEAVPGILDRLSKPLTRASAELLRPLALVYVDEKLVPDWSQFVRALHSKDTEVAYSGAISLAVFDRLPESVIAELRSALERRWPRLDPPERPGGGQTILNMPGGALMKSLVRANALSDSDMVGLIDHPDGGVSAIATRHVLSRTSDDQLRAYVGSISNRTRDPDFLKHILALPKERLRTVAEELARLAEDASDEVRFHIITVLANAEWLDRKTAEAALTRLTQLDDEDVRSAAVKALRLIAPT